MIAAGAPDGAETLPRNCGERASRERLDRFPSVRGFQSTAGSAILADVLP